MLAVFERELKSYFASPVGYVIIAAFYIFSGYFFFMGTLASNTADLSYVFSMLFTACIVFIPILTMRLFSEEQRNKTDQALLTAPVSLLSLSMGKYLAVLAMYLICIVITLVYAFVLAFFAPPDWAMIFGNFIGLFLLGAAFCAVGMFVSTLTESQVSAAIAAFFINIFLGIWDGLLTNIPNGIVKDAVGSLSFSRHYNQFTQGLLDFSDVVFFVSVCAVFVFFTIRVFERRRWR